MATGPVRRKGQYTNEGQFLPGEVIESIVKHADASGYSIGGTSLKLVHGTPKERIRQAQVISKLAKDATQGAEAYCEQGITPESSIRRVSYPGDGIEVDFTCGVSPEDCCRGGLSKAAGKFEAESSSRAIAGEQIEQVANPPAVQ